MHSPTPTPLPCAIESQALALNPEAVEVDVVSFERQAAEGTVTALERAVELYRGDLLLGFALDEPLFEEWLVTERERLREMAMDALARLLSHQTSTGATERAIQTAVRLLGLDPLQETVHRTLMRLYSRQGRRGAALKQYQACVGALQRELGTAPEEGRRSSTRSSCGVPPRRRPLSLARAVARPPRGAGGGAPPDLPALETPLIGREEDLAPAPGASRMPSAAMASAPRWWARPGSARRSS